MSFRGYSSASSFGFNLDSVTWYAMFEGSFDRSIARSVRPSDVPVMPLTPVWYPDLRLCFDLMRQQMTVMTISSDSVMTRAEDRMRIRVLLNDCSFRVAIISISSESITSTPVELSDVRRRVVAGPRVCVVTKDGRFPGPRFGFGPLFGEKGNGG